LNSSKILIVEDEIIVAFDLRQTLENIGYEVVGTVTSYDEIIACINEKKVDLILMDIYLNDGDDGVKIAREINESFEIPVIFLTGHSDTETFKRAKKTNPFGFIVKPFNERDLRLNIEIALNSHKVQKDLKKSEFVKNKILESISEFVLYVSPERKIKWFNTFVEEMCKSNTGKFKDSKCFELVFGRETPCEQCPLDEILKYNDIFSKRRQFDGDSIWEITATPIYYEENILGMVEIGNNITERVKYENKLIKERNIAERANSIKDNFLANVSHELRTPLNGINLALKVINKTKFSNEEREYLNMIELSSKRLLEVIEKILDATVMDNENLEYSAELFTIDEILEHVNCLLEDKINSSRLEYTISNQFDSHTIFSDRKKLEKILFNIIDNALKFTEKGDVNINITENKKDENKSDMIITVSDTGPGIPVEDQKIIFDKFLLLNDSHSRTHDGLGLGLTIVKEYVEFLNGKIKLQSSPGRGSKFEITIPVKTN